MSLFSTKDKNNLSIKGKKATQSSRGMYNQKKGPWDKQGALPVLIRRRKAVRGTDALLALSHVHLMEFLQLVTRAQGRTGEEKKSKPPQKKQKRGK
jgi:hypothetical protein